MIRSSNFVSFGFDAGMINLILLQHTVVEIAPITSVPRNVMGLQPRYVYAINIGGVICQSRNGLKIFWVNAAGLVAGWSWYHRRLEDLKS